ncbi:MAG: Na+/H+ antiporter NhaA [Chitinophagaceae bacterium]|nr:Na+/H+ antiporter NhaA [Oligoflexus sp.]
MAKRDEPLAPQNFRPQLRIDRMMGPFHRFVEIEASGGIVLLVATLVALFLANTSFNLWYNEFWRQTFKITMGDAVFEMSLLHLINDGLMTLFFFVVGLEVKREFTLGEFRSPRAAVFPIIGALGGMAIPCLMYFAIEGRGIGARGFAIPMATDIAFVVGFLSLLGKRVPHSLKIMLLTLAIVDDMGAVFVIASVYTKGLIVEYIFVSLGFYLLVFVLNFFGVRRMVPYMIVGGAMWFFLLKSGVHPTVAGVLLGLAAPSGKLLTREPLVNFLSHFQKYLDEADEDTDAFNFEPLRAAGHEANSPLERLESDLHPWVAYLIMPVFALANAGVPVQLIALESGTAWAVILSLVVGKPLGIFGFGWLAQKARIASFPDGVTARVLFAASCLCGVGFTMSIFVAGLALDGDLLSFAKVGTLIGSALSACLGLYLLHRFLDRREPEVAETLSSPALSAE